MRRMLSDRQQMNLTLNSSGETIFVKEDDPIYVWMVEKFNGKDIGVKVFWDAGLPGGELEAGHYPSPLKRRNRNSRLLCRCPSPNTPQRKP